MYRGLDVITNKVTVEEQRRCRHHLIGYIDPFTPTNTVVDFRNHALPIVSFASLPLVSLLQAGFIASCEIVTIWLIASCEIVTSWVHCQLWDCYKLGSLPVLRLLQAEFIASCEIVTSRVHCQLWDCYKPGSLPVVRLLQARFIASCEIVTS